MGLKDKVGNLGLEKTKGLGEYKRQNFIFYGTLGIEVDGFDVNEVSVTYSGVASNYFDILDRFNDIVERLPNNSVARALRRGIESHPVREIIDECDSFLVRHECGESKADELSELIQSYFGI